MSISPVDELALPQDLKGLNSEWLSAALSCHYPGVEVTAAEVDGVIAGTASKVRLRLEYNQAGRQSGLPPTLYAKGGFHGARQRELARDGYEREVAFFNTYALQLKGLEIPRCYFAATDGAQAIVLLEDLTARGAHFGRATEPVSSDTAAATLEWLASLHGRYWNRPPKTAAPQRWPGIIREVIDGFLTPEVWEAMIARPVATSVPDAMRDPKRVRGALLAMWDAFTDAQRTFIHGDAHLGNMYFLADGSPGFLDWQSPMWGPPMDDVTYFLIGALSVEDRRRHERELLKHYLSCLGAIDGVDAPSFDQAWLAYRRQVMHGFMWVATPPEMQPDEIVAANTVRFCTALSDLETLDALGISEA